MCSIRTIAFLVCVCACARARVGGYNSALQLPYGNELRLVVVNGTTIKATLEHSVRKDEPVGSFLVTDGLRFWWNPTAKPYSRIVKVEVHSAFFIIRFIERFIQQFILNSYIPKLATVSELLACEPVSVCVKTDTVAARSTPDRVRTAYASLLETCALLRASAP